MEKQKVFLEIQRYLEQHQIQILSKDESRPWGGFFVIDESAAENFIDFFFSTLDKSQLLNGKISPKILLVEPQKKLSWQYHHRRSEIWKLIQGDASIVRSNTDEEQDPEKLILNEIITLEQGERHRLVGMDQWGIIAEIWMHTDPNHLSDENDIVRVKDDFGR